MGLRDAVGRSGRAAALLAVGAVGTGAAFAVASVPDSNGVIHACYLITATGSTVPSGSPGESNLRIIDPSQGQSCNTVAGNGPLEREIDWNQQGPTGPQGPPGHNGAPGQNGAKGAPGQQGTVTYDLVQPSVKPNAPPVGGMTLTPGKLHFKYLGFGWGQGNPTKTGGNGQGPGKSSFSITKKVDRSSPALFRDAAKGVHFKQALLVVGKNSTAYLTYTFHNVLIASDSQSGQKTGTPTESVTFSFGSVNVVYNK